LSAPNAMAASVATSSKVRLKISRSVNNQAAIAAQVCQRRGAPVSL
jgi:hypothetical protein